MDSLESKKLALVRILQILEKYSDERHPLLQADIAGHLEREYGIVIERKAISRNLSLLKEAGFEIESGRSGSYLAERSFTDAELRILIDGVLSSKYISRKYSKDLIDKLCGLSNKYFLSHVKHIYTINDLDKSDNAELFYNIELIDEAIEKKRQIRFQFNKYGPNKKLHKSATHHVSPYQLILHNQRYYLMGHNPFFDGITFFRLDHITNMSILEDKLEPLNTIPGYEHGINYKDFASSHPYLFTDKPEWVEFVTSADMIDQIIDWFGKGITIRSISEETVKIGLNVSPYAMEHWAMQYAGYITVTSPLKLVERIEKRLQEATTNYLHKLSNR